MIYLFYFISFFRIWVFWSFKIISFILSLVNQVGEVKDVPHGMPPGHLQADCGFLTCTAKYISDPMCTRCFRDFGKTECPSCNFSVGKKLLKNVTLQISKFISVNKLIKNFPVRYNVNSKAVFSIPKNQRKEPQNWHYIILWGKCLLVNFTKIKFEIWRVTFLNSFLPLKMMGWTSGFLEITKAWSVHASEMYCSTNGVETHADTAVWDLGIRSLSL